MIERYGYEKARRIGVVAMIGGKDKERLRDRTPGAFRDVLLSIARATTNNQPQAAALSSPDGGPMGARQPAAAGPLVEAA